jgi:hypothetical protein
LEQHLGPAPCAWLTTNRAVTPGGKPTYRSCATANQQSGDPSTQSARPTFHLANLPLVIESRQHRTNAVRWRSLQNHFVDGAEIVANRA